jgi:flavin reductase
VSSITGLSVDPPRLLFCVRREASAHDALAGANLCGVNILSADEADAPTFIDPILRDRRFAGVHWRRAAAHPPVLETGLSSAICLVDRVIDAGSHSILIVSALSLHVRPGEPLLSFNRDLRRLLPDEREGGSGNERRRHA